MDRNTYGPRVDYADETRTLGVNEALS